MSDASLRSEFLFALSFETGEAADLGIVNGIHRRDVPLVGGRFDGPTLRGRVLPGGADRLSIRADKAVLLDVRSALETVEGERIGLAYRGIRHAAPDVFARWERGEDVPVEQYYMRIALSFETSAPRLLWLNDVIGIGLGRRTPQGPVYQVHRLL